MGPDSDPPIVGIGASAGEVKAVQSFFEALPDDPSAAFVVVVHLDPELRSQLPNILASRTSMPVIQVEQTERLQSNHVYVIAPNSRLSSVITPFLRFRLTNLDIREHRLTCSFVPLLSSTARALVPMIRDYWMPQRVRSCSS
jgi:chemotaxis response regulator CheB